MHAGQTVWPIRELPGPVKDPASKNKRWGVQDRYDPNILLYTYVRFSIRTINTGETTEGDPEVDLWSLHKHVHTHTIKEGRGVPRAV